MSLNPPPENLREITPDERRRITRTFIGILLGLVLMVGGTVAYLSAQGRVIRDYGEKVLTDTRQGRSWPDNLGRQDCTALSQQPVPSGVKSCVVERQGAEYTVIIGIEGERQYQIK